MAIACKPTVRLGGLTRPLVRIFTALVELDAHPVDGQPPVLLITSLNDSQHGPQSRHYRDEAVDVRSKSFRDAASKSRFLAAARSALGSDYTVLYEGEGTANEHFHFQPRKGTT